MAVWEGTPAQIEAATDAVWKSLNEHRPIPLSAAECRDAALAVLAAAEKAKPKFSTGGVGSRVEPQPLSPDVRKVDGKPREAFTPVTWIGPGVYEEKDGGFVKLDTASEAAGVTLRRAAALGEDWFPHNGCFSLATHPVEVMTRSGNARRGSGFRESQFLWSLNARSSEDIVAYRPA